MTDDRALIDSNNFEALAFGVFDSAGDTDSGRAALLQAYNSYLWTDPDKAKETLEYYGEALKFKNKDQTSFGPAIEQIAPIKLTDIPLTQDMTDQDLFDRWEELNTEYLKSTTEPEYLVARKQLMEDVKDYASEQRRIVNQQAIQANLGETGAGLVDLSNRFLRGLVSGVEPLVNSAVNIFTDDFELNNYVTEITDPNQDSTFLSAFAEGGGSVVGVIGAGAAGGAIAVAGYTGVQAVDAVGTRYQDTKRKTGDTNAAVKAAAIETGSQALQIGAANLVFGKLAGAVRGGPSIQSIPRAIATEAFGEGGGQLISNQAEDIENQKAGDPLRGVGTATLLGGFFAGAASGYEKRFPGAKNTDVRTAEINQFGAPITPVTKQQVGPIESVNVDTIPGETEFINSQTGEVIEPATEDAPAINSIPAPETFAYTTEDGKAHFQTEPNQYVEDGQLPHDRTFFLSEDNARKIAGAISDGDHLVIGNDGAPVIERTEDGATSYEKVPVVEEPETGLYPLSISFERSPSKQEKVRPVKLGQRIKEVNVDRSLGAAGRETETQKESTYSQELRKSALPPGMQEAGEKGIFYTPITLSEISAEANAFVREAGIAGAIKAAQDPSVDPRLRAGIQTYLHDFFTVKMTEALQNGDDALYERISNDFQNTVAPIISAGGTIAGQALVSRRGKTYGDPLPVREAYNQAYEQSLIDQAKEEGVDPLEIGKSAEVVDQTTKAIAQTEQVIERQQAIDADFVTPEDQAVNEVVTDIEEKAQDKVQQDLTAIDKEATELNESIETTTKKAERTKRKDIQALEGAVAADSEALASALSTARDLKNVTAEESAKIEEAVSKSLQAAEKKASAEVTKAVKEERARIEEEKKTRLERSQERLAKAEQALADRKARAAEQLQKLKLKERSLLKEGQDTAVIAQRIQEIEDRITNAAQRVVDAKENLRAVNEELSAKTEATQQAEDLLQELESGIEVRVSPTGKKRAISVRTKRSGLNVTKLFNTKSEAYGPLSALSRSVNELASTVSQSLGAKATSNERIAELQKRINENKAALEKSRARDALSDKEKARVAAAKKRLADLERAKTEATVESRIPVKDREKYKKFKDQQQNAKRGRKEDSPELKAAKETLRKLNAEKAKAERLLQRRAKAKQKAVEAAQRATENQKRIAVLRDLLKDENLSVSAKNKIQAEIAARTAVDEKLPPKRDSLYRLWVASQIGSILGITVGTGSSLFIAPVSKSLGLVGSSVKAFVKNIGEGKLNKYKYPLLEYWAGLTNPEAIKRGLSLSRIAFSTGQRLENIIPRKELVARSEIRGAPVTYQEVAAGYTNFTRSLEFKDFNLKNAVENAFILAQKAAGETSGFLLRTLAAVEATTYSIHDSGFDRAAAAYYYNKNSAADVTEAELAKYKYNPNENWKRAQAEAAVQANSLRASGIEFTPKQEYVSAVEIYQRMRPREVQVSAFKQAAQTVLNGPAPGLTGMFSDYLQKFTNNLRGTPGAPLRYLTPFSNSIAHQLMMAMDLTPLALGGLTTKANRTAFERSMLISSAATGTTIAMGLALLAIKNLEDDEATRAFDIVGNYSSDKKKRDAFVQSGGLLYSIKIGNTYVPYNETPFVLLFGGVATAVDRVREGKDPAPENAATFAHSAFTMAEGVIGGIGNISMLKGVNDIADAVKDAVRGQQGSDIKVARILMNTVKGFIPGASLLRNLSRYTDNPVDAKKDITSALVEGVPGLQSAFGKAALNIFGEPMPAGRDNDTLKLHRLFSTKASDIDIRWLTDNGYTVPGIANMRFSKKIQQFVAADQDGDAAELDYNTKYEVYRAAASDLRDVVGIYRQRFGHSAFNPKVQEALNKDFNRILAKYTAQVVR